MSGNSDIKGMLERTKGVDIHNEGKKIISAMSQEERSVLRSKCHTLHFVKLLKLASKRADRMVAGQETRVSYKAVGVVLYSGWLLKIKLQKPHKIKGFRLREFR